MSRSYGDGRTDGVSHALQRGPILIEVSRALYVASYEVGVTHWLVQSSVRCSGSSPASAFRSGNSGLRSTTWGEQYVMKPVQGT